LAARLDGGGCFVSAQRVFDDDMLPLSAPHLVARRSTGDSGSAASTAMSTTRTLAPAASASHVDGTRRRRRSWRPICGW